jgi:aspartokinase
VSEFLDARGACAKEVAAYPGCGLGLLLLSLENIHGFGTLRAELETRFGGAVTCQEGVGSVCVVGVGINADGSHLRRALSALESLEVPVEAISATSLRLTVLVPADRVKESVRRLHDEFVGR